MQNNPSNNVASFENPNHSPEPITKEEAVVRAFIEELWREKVILTMFVLLFAIFGVVTSIQKPNIYRAEVLLAPSSEGGDAGGLSSIASQYGGLASLAGVSLSGGASEIEQTLAILESRAFITAFLEEHDVYVHLFATEAGGLLSPGLTINSEIYDKENKAWLVSEKTGLSYKPSAWDGYKTFSSKLLVSKNKKTGLIKLSIEWYDPNQAKQWLDWLVNDLNNKIRNRDLEDARKSIDFLKTSLVQTSVLGFREVFYSLIESQTKTMMLAKVREEYVLKTIDPAVVPEEKIRPVRSTYCIMITVLGLFVGVVFVVLRKVISNHREINV
ncbi:MAG: LPS O-antigen length regulator [Gammaproteobacteria bacterium]|nr:MAG: LPS O-antigen length regulator [Gammaproteobacteria bacterium]